MYYYSVIKQELQHPYIGQYTTYGIAARCGAPDGELQAFIPDVTTDHQAAEALAQQCSDAALEPVHLRDVVIDFLNA